MDWLLRLGKMGKFQPVAAIDIDPDTMVMEQGWQSWSPSGWYGIDEAGPMPRSAQGSLMGFRTAMPRWRGGYQSEGVIVIERGHDSVLISGESPTLVPTFRAFVDGDVLRVFADRGVVVSVSVQPSQVVLATWAGEVARALGCPPLRPVPPGWCSWYCYERSVSEDLVLAEVEHIEELELPVEVILLDEGYEAALGDWLTEREGFGSLPRLAQEVRSRGRIPAIWVAPFVAGVGSRVEQEHPEWWLAAVSAGHVWGYDLAVLDVSNDAALRHLTGVFSELVGMGFGAFKLDFLYAGALGGGGRLAAGGEDTEAYRHVLSAIRAEIGPDPFLFGCGAPLLPSVGLFDSMRVSCDVGPTWRVVEDAAAQPATEVWYPSIRGALRSGTARAFAHGLWWVNDPDCIIAGPQVESRDIWASYVEQLGGIAFSGDALKNLGGDGLELTRRLLREASVAPLDRTAIVRIDEMGRKLPL